MCRSCGIEFVNSNRQLLTDQIVAPDVFDVICSNFRSLGRCCCLDLLLYRIYNTYKYIHQCSKCGAHCTSILVPVYFVQSITCMYCLCIVRGTPTRLFVFLCCTDIIDRDHVSANFNYSVSVHRYSSKTTAVRFICISGSILAPVSGSCSSEASCTLVFIDQYRGLLFGHAGTADAVQSITTCYEYTSRLLYHVLLYWYIRVLVYDTGCRHCCTGCSTAVPVCAFLKETAD